MLIFSLNCRQKLENSTNKLIRHKQLANPDAIGKTTKEVDKNCYS